MLTLHGSSALSAFQKSKILSMMQSIVPTVIDVDAQFLHFVTLDDGQTLSEEENGILGRALTYGAKTSNVKESSSRFLVIPRLAKFVSPSFLCNVVR